MLHPSSTRAKDLPAQKREAAFAGMQDKEDGHSKINMEIVIGLVQHNCIYHDNQVQQIPLHHMSYHNTKPSFATITTTHVQVFLLKMFGGPRSSSFWQQV